MGPREGLDVLAKGNFVGRGGYRMCSERFVNSTVTFEIACMRDQRHFIDCYIALCGVMVNK